MLIKTVIFCSNHRLSQMIRDFIQSDWNPLFQEEFAQKLTLRREQFRHGTGTKILKFLNAGKIVGKRQKDPES